MVSSTAAAAAVAEENKRKKQQLQQQQQQQQLYQQQQALQVQQLGADGKPVKLRVGRKPIQMIAAELQKKLDVLRNSPAEWEAFQHKIGIASGKQC